MFACLLFFRFRFHVFFWGWRGGGGGGGVKVSAKRTMERCLFGSLLEGKVPYLFSKNKSSQSSLVDKPSPVTFYTNSRPKLSSQRMPMSVLPHAVGGVSLTPSENIVQRHVLFSLEHAGDLQVKLHAFYQHPCKGDCEEVHHEGSIRNAGRLKTIVWKMNTINGHLTNNINNNNNNNNNTKSKIE